MTVNKPSVESQAPFYTSWNKRLFAWMMAQGSLEYEKAVGDRKQALFADLHGDVLEIGPGTGPNLPYYPQDIHWIGIEPNPYMHSSSRKKQIGSV